MAGHKAVNELVFVIITAIGNDGLAGLAHQGKALVFEAAESGQFARSGCWIVRVVLHHPAEAVGLVGLYGNIEAAVVVTPVAIVGANAECMMIVRFFGVGHIVRVPLEGTTESLFGHQYRAPWRLAAGAVAHGAEHLAAAAIGRSNQALIARGGTDDVHGGAE